MAEKIKLIELDIDIDALKSNVSETLSEVQSLSSVQSQLKKATKALNDTLSTEKDKLKEIASASGKNSTEYQNQKAVVNNLKKSINQNNEALVENQSKLKAARSEYNLGIKALDAYHEKNRNSLSIIKQTDGSIDQLSVALSNNRAIYKSLTKEQREDTEIGGKLLDIIQSQDEEYKALNKSIGQTGAEVGNYKDAIKQAFAEGDIFNNQMSSLIGQIPVVGSTLSGVVTNLSTYVKGQKAAAAASNTTTGSLKLLKIALISTGIGAIVVALGALVAAFVSTQRGADAVAKYIKPIGTILQKVLGVVQELSEKMIDAFKNPQDTIKKLWEAIKTNIANRITGLTDSFKFLGKTIQAALDLDFKGVKENALAMGESVTQTLTGVDELGNKITDAAKKTGEFISESYKQGQQLADLNKQIEETENDLIVTRASLTAEYEKQKEIADDTSKSAQERYNAAQAEIDAQNQLLDANQALLDKKIEAKKLELSLNDTDREAQKELNELIAERISFEAEAAGKRASARTALNTLESELQSNRIAGAQKEVEAALAASEQRLKIYVAENEGVAKTLDEKLAYAKSVYNQDVAILKQKLDAKKMTQDEYNLEIIKANRDLLEKQTELTVEHASNELDLYIATNKSKITENTKLNDSLVSAEEERLQKIYDKQIAYLDAQNLSDQEYNLQKLEYQNEYLESKQELEDEYREQKQEQSQEDYEQQLTDLQNNFLAQQELKLQHLEAEKAAEIAKAEEAGASIVAIEKKYAATSKKIEKAKRDYKLNLASQTLANMQTLFGEETVAGKAAGIAQATVDTYLGATAAMTGMIEAVPGPVGIALGAVAAAATVASGVANIKEIAKAEHGAVIDIGGKRHSAGGTKFYGEDGSRFEAETGEKMFILNRAASAALGPSLSRINQMYGGVSLSKSSSYLAQGGTVSAVSGSSKISVDSNSAIDYDLLAKKIGDNVVLGVVEGNKNLPNPVTLVGDIIDGVSSYNEVIAGANV